MVKKRKPELIIILLAILLASCQPALWKSSQTHPTLHPDGRKWRLAYYEAGYYIDYEMNLRALVQGLSELGWIDPIEIPSFKEENNKLIWEYVSQNISSDYLEFPKDAFWSADWQDQKRVTNRDSIIQTINQSDQIDIVIAMGTWAGQDLANDLHQTPTLVLTSSGPIEAGIINDYTDSGYDHVLVEVDPYRYRRQIEQFHNIVGFSKLGVVYENTPDGRIYSNIADLETVANERGFELITCNASDIQDNISLEEAAAQLQECYKILAPDIDALWIGAHVGEEPQFMPDSLESMFTYNVATWSQYGEAAVRRGVLMSISQHNYKEAGQWYASNIASICNGITPRELDQIFELPVCLMINLETARIIGFEFPPGLLKAVDYTYNTIEGRGDNQ